jgi:pyruvate/2-oxoglutarate dehydrogenase complex dihydrolipoamide dehydrogenase (E3) component
MPQPEQFEILVLGSGTGGKLLAWDTAQSGRRTAVVERQWIGGACPNIACLPGKNEIRSAEVAHLARHAAQYGTMTGPVAVEMAVVRKRKRDNERRRTRHGKRRFVAPKTIEVQLNDGGTRLLAGERIFVDVGTHASPGPDL